MVAMTKLTESYETAHRENLPGGTSTSVTNKTRNIGILVAMNLIWAGTYPATSLALRGMTPEFLTMVRLGVGALAFLPFLRLTRGKLWDVKLGLLALGLGIVGFSIPVYLQSLGLFLSTPALAAISIALEPLVTMVIAAMWLQEVFGRGRKWALVMAVVGAWAVAGFPTLGHAGYAYGDLLLLVAIGCFAVYNVFSARLSQVVGSSTATAATLLGGFIGSVPIWLATGARTPHTWIHGELWALLYLSILATALAYFLWMFSVRRVPVSLVALFLYLQPVLGVLLSVIITHTQLSFSFFVGALLILGALFVGQERFGRIGEQPLEKG